MQIATLLLISALTSGRALRGEDCPPADPSFAAAMLTAHARRIRLEPPELSGPFIAVACAQVRFEMGADGRAHGLQFVYASPKGFDRVVRRMLLRSQFAPGPVLPGALTIRFLPPD